MRRSTSFRATAGSIFSKPRKYCSYRARRRSSRVSSSSRAMSSSSKFTASPGKRRHFDVVEADRDIPVVETEKFVPGAGERLGVVERVDQGVVDREANGATVGALDLETVRAPLGHGRRARIFRAGDQAQLPAIRSVFVQSREHVQTVLPTAENGNVARRVD